MRDRYWTTMGSSKAGELDIVIDKTWEDLHPKDCCDESCYDIEDICAKIDRYDLEWFILRVRVFYEDIELGREMVGGLLYEDASDVFSDGTANDLIWAAMEEAKKRARELKTKFMELEVDNIAV